MVLVDKENFGGNMREELHKICDDFLEKREMISEIFAWYNARLYPVCAEITLDKQDITKEKILQCKKLVEENTNVFSEVRGNAFPVVVSYLACEQNPKELMEEILKIYKKIRTAGIPSGYLSVVAVILAVFGDEKDYDAMIGKTRELYGRMRAEHPFLTTGEDSPFAAMLAVDSKDAQMIAQEVEQCYKFLKGNFFSKNAVQSLSHVLAMGEEDALEKCRRFMDLYNTFKMKGYQFDTEYYLPVLGAASLIPMDINEMVEDVIALASYLEGKPGFGLLNITKKEIMAHATIIVCKEYLSRCIGQVLDAAMFSATVAGITTAIVMQTTAVGILT